MYVYMPAARHPRREDAEAAGRRREEEERLQQQLYLGRHSN